MMRLGDSDFCRTSKDYNVEKHVPENRTQLYHLPHLFRGARKPAEHYVIYLHEGLDCRTHRVHARAPVFVRARSCFS